MQWLPLLHPEKGLQPQGYLLASCYIITVNDKPPVHEIGQMNVQQDEEDQFMGKADSELTVEQLMIRKQA